MRCCFCFFSFFSFFVHSIAACTSDATDNLCTFSVWRILKTEENSPEPSDCRSDMCTERASGVREKEQRERHSEHFVYGTLCIAHWLSEAIHYDNIEFEMSGSFKMLSYASPNFTGNAADFCNGKRDQQINSQTNASRCVHFSSFRLLFASCPAELKLSTEHRIGD